LETTSYNVLVVGGGLAGLVAGSRAAELGGDVLLLDKGDLVSGGGNTLMTTGTFYTAGISPNSAADELYTRAMSGAAANPALAEAWANNCQRALQWLESVGLSVDRTGEAPPRLETNSPISVAPVYKTDTGVNIVKKLLAFFHSHRGASRTRTRVVKLLAKRGKVLGIEAMDSSGKRFEVTGGATVLATGGFQASREILSKFIGRHADGCKLMGSANASGDGLKMALAVGAKTVNMKYLHGHMVSLKALTDDRFWPYPTMDTLIEDGIVVNMAGMRFSDEGWGDIPLANAIARWNDVTGASLIFDEEAWARSKGDASSLVPPNPWLTEKGGGVCKAETVPELAKLLGVNRKNLEVTVEEFNTAARKRRLGELAVPRITNARPLNPPYYGLRVVPGIISTMGGPLTDGRTRVHDEKGEAIPGLFAAGDVVGGLMGGRNGGYVGGISQAAVTGMLAGENAYKYSST
jgi:succinate dehydrogenase/fumarate reductase flavoprotein subunit